MSYIHNVPKSPILSVSQSPVLPISTSLSLKVSPSQSPKVSPSHRLKVSPSHRLKVLITGVAGFIGSNLADRLLKEKIYRVIGIDNLSYGVKEQIPEGVKFHLLDIRDTSIYPIFRNVDFVFHFAAKNCISDCQLDPVETADINVRGTVNVFEAAKRANVKKVIYAESSAMYEGSHILPTPETEVKPESFYAVSKLCSMYFAHAYSRFYGSPSPNLSVSSSQSLPVSQSPGLPVSQSPSLPFSESPILPFSNSPSLPFPKSPSPPFSESQSQGLKFTALRYFCVYGPRQDYRRTIPPVFSAFIIKLLKGEQPIIYGTGEKRRDFIHVDDINDFHIKCMQDSRTEGEVFNLGSGHNYSVNEIYDIISRLLKSNVRPKYMQDLPGEAFANLADITKAKSLGWNPKIDLKEGLRTSIDFISNEIKSGYI